VHNIVVVLSMNGSSNNGGSPSTAARVGTDRVKQGLAQMLKGGVIVRNLSARGDERECVLQTEPSSLGRQRGRERVWGPCERSAGAVRWW
jgi:hypothetical protein